jgi:hypothetical protein
MSDIKNCWEFMKCGREPGGKNTGELGICPASTCVDYDGVNRGTKSGRFCWAVAGTYCKGKVSGTYAEKLADCLKCKFLRQIYNDEGENFKLTICDVKKTKPEEE